MEEIVLVREFSPALGKSGFYDMAREAMGCMDIYRAQWSESLMSEDGSRLICRFQAPDTESLRQMSRGDGAAYKAVWPATIHESDFDALARVVVERNFEAPASMDELQARENAAATCLQLHRVDFIRSFFSTDRTKMVCLYTAPDAESVRVAQSQARMPFDKVWGCQHFTPENMFS